MHGGLGKYKRSKSNKLLTASESPAGRPSVIPTTQIAMNRIARIDLIDAIVENDAT